MNRIYFGTDGIRGPFGGPVINEAFARRFGIAVGRWLVTQPPGGQRDGPARPSQEILIGWDTRRSGEPLADAIAHGLASAGWLPVSLGVLPSPAIARAVQRSGAAMGIVVTASHNPASDNGFKLFASGGRKLADAEESEIEESLPDMADAGGRGFSRARDCAAEYVSAARALLPGGALKGWRMALDTANGATCATSAAAFRELGADLVGIGNAPDGSNINAGVGSEHPELLCGKVRAGGARIGVAHDGDGDRCVVCDERGDLLDGDEMMGILATRALERGKLAARTLVTTVQSNLGLDAAVRAAGGRVVRTPVGDRYVIEGMRAEGATLGGESSGHIVFSEISPTGDGLVAALKLIEAMLDTGQPLSVLRRRITKFPQATAALVVRGKRPLRELAGLSAAIREVEAEFGAAGRVLVRYSGTEPLLRLLVEGPDSRSVRSGLDRLLAAAGADLK
ncbi:MAG: phosphoglucosamine mutase [Opitutaceae bacterium]